MRVGLLLGVLLLAPAVPGCLTCQPLLEVRHVFEAPDVPMRVWTQEDAEAWPEVDRILRTLEPGEHEHRKWTAERQRAFWEHYGVDPEAQEKELWFEHDGEAYRVRVLEC